MNVRRGSRARGSLLDIDQSGGQLAAARLLLSRQHHQPRMTTIPRLLPGVTAMNQTHDRLLGNSVAERIRATRASWSPRERLQRAVEGRRRRERLANMLFAPDGSPEIWAAGAFTLADVARLAS